MRIWKYIYLVLTLALSGVVITLTNLPDTNLHIIACSVGQGDAILIKYKNIEILTDGGPNNKVIDCLSKYLPVNDREIELVISTHPDADHATGLIEVVRRYKVANILINPINSGTQTIGLLEKEVGSRGINIIKPVEGQSIGLDLIYLDIFNPSESQVLGLSKQVAGDGLGFFTPEEPSNEYSVTFRLAFKEFTGVFAGDLGPEVSNRLAGENKIGDVEYIKVPHHGSNNGLTENLLKQLMPKIAVISVGKNSYGHPSLEILKLLSQYGVNTYRTDLLGDVEVITDGEKYWIK